jgi:hypothetical protein
LVWTWTWMCRVRPIWMVLFVSQWDSFVLFEEVVGGFGLVTYVEPRDDAVEGGCAVGVCWPHAAQPGAVVGYERLVERVSYTPGFPHS